MCIRDSPRGASLHDISAHDYLLEAHYHGHHPREEPDSLLRSQLHERNAEPVSVPTAPPEVKFDTLLAYATKGTDVSLGDVRNMLSTPSLKTPGKYGQAAPPASAKDLVIVGKTYRCVNHTETYSVSKHASTMNASLVDRGANGGIAGDDVRIIDRTHRSVDVCGIDNHQLTNVPIVTAGGVATSQHGEVIVILNQYAYTGKGKSIHSCAQMEW